MNRLETVVLPATSKRAGRDVRVRAPRVASATRRSFTRLAAILLVVAAIAGGAFALRTWDASTWASIVAFARNAGNAAMAPAQVSAAPVTRDVARDAALALPQRGETTLTSARVLVASGHLRDALAALETIRPTDVQKGEADRLRADIQRQLLALSPVPAAAAPDRDKGERRVP